MTGFILFLAGITAFYLLVYKKWELKRKFTFKVVSVHLLLGVTLLMIFATVSTITQVAENEQYRMLENRLARAEDTARRRDYYWMADNLQMDMDYEEEFEYLWERLMMYNACNRYLIFNAADQRGLGEAYGEKARDYEQLLREIAENPSYEVNVPYGKEFYRQKEVEKKAFP